MKLYNGQIISNIGAGTYPYKKELISIIPELIDCGYKLFDTSDNYYNEEYLGEGLATLSENILDNIVVITKYSRPQKKVIRAYEESSKKIFGKTVRPNRKADIYLMHWPYPYLWERRWKEMEELVKRGDCKSIGVCNFEQDNLERLLSICEIKPVINQIEYHPLFQQKNLFQFCKKENIQVISYSPFARMNSDLFNDSSLVQIAETHKKNVTQIITKWNIQEGRVPIPASKNVCHMENNFDISDFSLCKKELEIIDSINKGIRIRYDPKTRFSTFQKILFYSYSKMIRVLSK